MVLKAYTKGLSNILFIVQDILSNKYNFVNFQCILSFGFFVKSTVREILINVFFYFTIVYFDLHIFHSFNQYDKL